MNNLKATFQIISDESVKKIQDSLSSLSIKEEKENRKFKVVASTEDIDRSWEIIKANWWIWNNFMKNPVIIANHVYKIENIVGKATKIFIENKQLVIEWVFSSSNPLGVLLADLYEEWMVKTVSVWFIPKKRDEKNSNIITEAELLELSFVAVPCNPNALSLDQKQLLEENWMLEKSPLFSGTKKAENSSDLSDDDIDNFWKNSTSNKEILSILNDIKSLLEILVDGNTKKLSEANIIAKETLQWAARAINSWLEKYKKALKN